MTKTDKQPFQFEKTIEVFSFQIDPSGKLRWSALADMMQEVAWKHADSRDFGQKLFDLGLMWVLSRFEIKVHQMPTWGEKIIIKTAGRGIHKLFALREFLIEDIQGNILAEAMSAWLLLDIKSKRPLRPAQALPAELFNPNPDETLMPSKIITNKLTKSDTTIRVRYSDLDMNNHVNNVSYIRWVEDFCYEERIHFSELLINYISEATFGEEIEILFHCTNENAYIVGECNGRQVFSTQLQHSREEGFK